jgi:hypothetical protein
MRLSRVLLLGTVALFGALVVRAAWRSQLVWWAAFLGIGLILFRLGGL